MNDLSGTVDELSFGQEKGDWTTDVCEGTPSGLNFARASTIVHGDQSLIRAVCYREQLERTDQVIWADRLHRGLEDIGMGFIIGEDCKNKRNVWRKVKKRLKDIDRQITEGECRDKVALEIQSMIKTNWGSELYLYGEGRLSLIWFRLGAWRALKIVNEEGARICLICGRGETSHHILSEREATEALRKQFLPESFITSSRGHLAPYDLLNNAEVWENLWQKFDS
ncbi:hypothetical protein ANN_06859 [Periplaneta americana]|uniref:Uncharacterized protein n=1 Tax=Periplaneta americana TaxID=6978 RepID=A0ABQ8TES4_PERAM|nr:hypothetical protein ANN_06859 [Periplaneta americana]